MGNFGGFGGGNMAQLMKQAQAMQRQLKEAQEKLAEEEVTGTAGGGIVEVTLKGNKTFVGIKIKPEAVDPDDVEMLEDMINAAFEHIDVAFGKNYFVLGAHFLSSGELSEYELDVVRNHITDAVEPVSDGLGKGAAGKGEHQNEAQKGGCNFFGHFLSSVKQILRSNLTFLVD